MAKPSLKLYNNDREVRLSRIRLFGVGWMIIGLGGLLLMMRTERRRLRSLVRI